MLTLPGREPNDKPWQGLGARLGSGLSEKCHTACLGLWAAVAVTAALRRRQLSPRDSGVPPQGLLEIRNTTWNPSFVQVARYKL